MWRKICQIWAQTYTSTGWYGAYLIKVKVLGINERNKDNRLLLLCSLFVTFRNYRSQESDVSKTLSVRYVKKNGFPLFYPSRTF